jgi:hypothetical protein
VTILADVKAKIEQIVDHLVHELFTLGFDAHRLVDDLGKQHADELIIVHGPILVSGRKVFVESVVIHMASSDFQDVSNTIGRIRKSL